MFLSHTVSQTYIGHTFNAFVHISGYLLSNSGGKLKPKCFITDKDCRIFTSTKQTGFSIFTGERKKINSQLKLSKWPAESHV